MNKYSGTFPAILKVINSSLVFIITLFHFSIRLDNQSQIQTPDHLPGPIPNLPTGNKEIFPFRVGHRRNNTHDIKSSRKNWGQLIFIDFSVQGDDWCLDRFLGNIAHPLPPGINHQFWLICWNDHFIPSSVENRYIVTRQIYDPVICHCTMLNSEMPR